MHCIETSYNLQDADNMELFPELPKSKQLDIFEFLEIYKHSKNNILNLLNDQIELR